MFGVVNYELFFFLAVFLQNVGIFSFCLLKFLEEKKVCLDFKKKLYECCVLIEYLGISLNFLVTVTIFPILFTNCQ